MAFDGDFIVDQNTRHFVRSVREGGPAAMDGVLHAGDELLEVGVIFHCEGFHSDDFDM